MLKAYVTENQLVMVGNVKSKKPESAIATILQSIVLSMFCKISNCSKYGTVSQRQNRINQMLINMIVRDMQPVSDVEDSGFKDFVGIWNVNMTSKVIAQSCKICFLKCINKPGPGLLG